MASAAGRVNQVSRSPGLFFGHATQTFARAADCSGGTAGSLESYQSFSVRNPAQRRLATPAAAAMFDGLCWGVCAFGMLTDPPVSVMYPVQPIAAHTFALYWSTSSSTTDVTVDQLFF